MTAGGGAGLEKLIWSITENQRCQRLLFNPISRIPPSEHALLNGERTTKVLRENRKPNIVKLTLHRVTCIKIK